MHSAKHSTAGHKAATTLSGLLDEGIKLAERGDTAHGLEIFQQVLAQKRHPVALSYHGYCLAKEEGNILVAMQDCRTAQRLDPGNPLHYLNLGRVLLIDGRRWEGIRCLRDGLLYGNSPQIRKELERVGTRRLPPLSSLDRGHPLNVFLGKLLARLRLR